MRVCPVDDHSLHEIRLRFESVSGSDVSKAHPDFLSIAVLLMTKLIARESQDNEAIAEALKQLVHLLVIPVGCSSQGSDIFDEDDFPFEGCKVDYF